MSITLNEFILGRTVVDNVPSLSSFLKKCALNQTQMKQILSSSIGELGFLAERIYLGLLTMNYFQKFDI